MKLRMSYRPSQFLLLLSLYRSSSQDYSWEYHCCIHSKTKCSTHSFKCEFTFFSFIDRYIDVTALSYLYLYRWMLYAPAEYQSSFSSLWWTLLEVFWRNQTCLITQDKKLQTSTSVYPKVSICAPFMWESVQETVQECLHPLKQVKSVSRNIILLMITAITILS